ncbi:hypothetical protein H0H81_008496 [Sphagnurus paluster]|uniref:Xylanolytic transcriptional activator regulatory domain-containing protein n=1 Tax=Sphagnurus paluster TaxID=117069 RepID=A0A9P7FWV8_9AGAR|nr:hypothetical protein H0H81_008496 [Sphagnurus paluster]
MSTKYDIGPSQNYADDYDDFSDLVDISPTVNISGLDSTSGSNATVKNVRRRSSKGPSRKRGPPKGYIDAIEARLHQTEALLGIMLSSNDSRAQSLLRDIAKDPLAKEIINRVDNSPYGVKGRKRDGDTKPRASHQASSSESSLSTPQKPESVKADLTSTHPSNEWQDHVSAMLEASEPNDAPKGGQRLRSQASAPALGSSSLSNARLGTDASSASSVDTQSPARRTRRRIGTEDVSFYVQSNDGYESHRSKGNLGRERSGIYSSRRRSSPSSTESIDALSSGSDDEELISAVGQLSLNEDREVRYHGKASGLHLLGNKERLDSRNEGGIWRFPKARVWPPLPSAASLAQTHDDEFVERLPDHTVQENLLELYFKFVHPILPLVNKRAFMDAFKARYHDSDSSPSREISTGTGASLSPFNRRRRRVPTLLLLAMYATAARYSTPRPSDASLMWGAGDEYLNDAKVILDKSYAASRASTCQALLLMGYREIGIGAMAQAWTYIGMAIRMAQDLGMHRSADGWARADLGGQLFGEWELNERKRIWFSCVIMDKYVSSYIGRPLMIFDRDFDNTKPCEDDSEETEEWVPSSFPENWEMPPPVPGRIISCFNASATLSGILGEIIQTIYAVRPSNRHSEAEIMEKSLDRWYIDLPEHLRYEPGSNRRPTPPPHVLTLHMQYWCTVLLLHRAFIRTDLYESKNKSPDVDNDDTEVRALAEKSYELCAAAANHITSIGTFFSPSLRGTI